MGQQLRQQLGQIDRQALAAEVERAHAARTQAEDACCEVEELLWAVRHPRTWQQSWRRLAQLAGPHEPPPPH
jgi:hypothetical protein